LLLEKFTSFVAAYYLKVEDFNEDNFVAKHLICDDVVIIIYACGLTAAM